jgi:hypothetical protein
MAWEDFDRPGHERSADELRRVARYQRWLIAVVLAQLVLWLGYVALMVLGGELEDELRLPMVLTFILGAVGAVFVFLTSWELRGALVAAVFALTTFVPCMGLLVIVLVNGYATAELRKNGVRVGFFGANPGEIRDRPSYDDDDEAGW